MLSSRSDLPLDHDALSRFLPWIIAFMVYLAALALAGALVLNTLTARWDRGASATLTIQIPPAGDADEDERRVRAVLAMVEAMSGVVDARALERDSLMALLEPWLGDTAAPEDLPLPRLIDVELDPGGDVDVAALSQSLAAMVPGATVDDHRVWLDGVVRLFRAVEILAGAVLLLMSAATVGTVVFTTRTGLAIHHEVIEVLHLIGAQDAYIAAQFAARALALGLRGGAIGFALAVPTLLAIGALAAHLEAGLLPELSLGPGQWVVLAALPLVVAGIAMVTARLTVTRTLARML